MALDADGYSGTWWLRRDSPSQMRREGGSYASRSYALTLGIRGQSGIFGGGCRVIKVNVLEDRVAFEQLVTRDPEVVSFFAEMPLPTAGEVAVRALTVGVAGLKAMGVAGRMELIEKEFLKLTHGFSQSLATVERALTDKVDATFDPARAESVSARLSSTIQAANKSTSATIDEARVQLQRLIGDAFNPELTTSCVFQIVEQLGETRQQLDRAFDPAVEGSYLARLTEEVSEYFGDDGKIAGIVAAQVAPFRKELMDALQGLRDALVGQAAATQIRRLSPMSGGDFEDEVEDALRQVARRYGDSVERLGYQAGDSGMARCGDFVVRLREGGCIVVEAKDYSNPIPLRGDRGILALLRGSMVNRSAGFAIGVMKDAGGFPKEVGSFNDYDGDKVLCVFGEGGQLLEAAYRWARTSLLAKLAAKQGLDLAAVEEGIEEARRALRELARIEGKAKSIAKTADEIQGLVTFQARRAAKALDAAAAGVILEVREAS